MKRVVVVGVLLAACGGDDVPDSGYGRNESVPVQVSCAAMCSRIADCSVRLCNEDGMTSMYDDLRPLIESDCESSCSESVLAAQITAAQWSCLFTDSCRMVFGDDSCDADGQYTCD